MYDANTYGIDVSTTQAHAYIDRAHISPGLLVARRAHSYSSTSSTFLAKFERIRTPRTIPLPPTVPPLPLPPPVSSAVCPLRDRALMRLRDMDSGVETNTAAPTSMLGMSQDSILASALAAMGICGHARRHRSVLSLHIPNRRVEAALLTRLWIRVRGDRRG